MQVLVIYDIASDRIRNRVAERCKDYGLQRIQWSAFLGDLSRARRHELGQRLAQALEQQAGCIHIYPMTDAEVAQCVVIGRSPHDSD